MKNIMDHAAKQLMNCTDCLVDARNILQDAEDDHRFDGNLVEIRDRIDELDSLIDDLRDAQSYIENIDLNF